MVHTHTLGRITRARTRARAFAERNLQSLRAAHGARALREPLGAVRTWFLLVLGAAFLIEIQGDGRDPWANATWYLHFDMASWNIPIGRFQAFGATWVFDWSDVHIIFSPLELFLVGALVAILVYRWRTKAAIPFSWGSLRTPMLAFVGALAFGTLYGVATGADPTMTLWEIRGFLMMLLAYFLASTLIRSQADRDRVVWMVLLAATGLAIENILRWMLLLRNEPLNDLSYDHLDSLILGFAIFLCTGLLLLRGTRRQRIFAAWALPVLFFGILVMHRRAAFVVLGVGLIAFFLLLFRLRPRLAWKIVIPLVAVGAVYLVLFWNDDGALGQPARAVQTVIAPSERDQQSNLYRDMEKLDIIFNIREAPITGLGFGKPFTMYIPLPDLSWWRFWHYTTHNAILWVWMKDGLFGFATFFWLLARATYDGGRALDPERDRWHVLAALRRALSGGRLRRRDVMRAGRRAGAAAGIPGAKALLAHRSGEAALLVAAICYIPIQVAYSYVDLGLTMGRNMLLFGLALALISHAGAIWPKAAPAAESSTEETATPLRERGPHAPKPRAPNRTQRRVLHPLPWMDEGTGDTGPSLDGRDDTPAPQLTGVGARGSPRAGRHDGPSFDVPVEWSPPR
jgi:hypothetical protein